MLLNNNGKQKSPKRRFLLILGVAAFAGFCVLGLMIIFWDKFPLQLPPTQRKNIWRGNSDLCGVAFFALFKKEPR
jgi:hypothetical protein